MAAGLGFGGRRRHAGEGARDLDRRDAMTRRPLQRGRACLLGLGQRDGGVASPDDAKPVDGQRRGRFCKNTAIPTGATVALYMP
jgi:hypothetical protein